MTALAHTVQNLARQYLQLAQQEPSHGHLAISVQKRGGVVLVMVLEMLVLMAVMVIVAVLVVMKMAKVAVQRAVALVVVQVVGAVLVVHCPPVWGRGAGFWGGSSL